MVKGENKRKLYEEFKNRINGISFEDFDKSVKWKQNSQAKVNGKKVHQEYFSLSSFLMGVYVSVVE